MCLQLEGQYVTLAKEVDALRRRNVDLENAFVDDRVEVSVVRLRRHIVELERQVVSLDRENKQLQLATAKLEVYKRCVDKEAAQIRTVLRYSLTCCRWRAKWCGFLV